MFGVPKSNGATRVIWHGARVSEASVRPPAPRHQLSPTALLDLEAASSEHVFVAKRDGRCMFDQLQKPSSIVPFFGRPPLLAV